MNQLTINQIMLLLAVQRGTYANELSCGTTQADTRALTKANLIITNGGTLHTTSKGHHLVEGIKLLTNEHVTVGLELALPDQDFGRQQVGALDRFPTLVHGDFVVGAEKAGMDLSDVDFEKGSAQFAGGALYLVGKSDVTLKDITSDTEGRSFKTAELTEMDPVILATEAIATQTAQDRAKADVGSRHVVFKAISVHEVAVPIKSTRL